MRASISSIMSTSGFASDPVRCLLEPVIVRSARGLPRLVNRIADYALVAAALNAANRRYTGGEG